MNSYILNALLKTKWCSSLGGTATLRFYPAVDAEGPRCMLARQPPNDTPDPVRNMAVNASNGAILYEYGARTFVHRPREPLGFLGPVLGVLALVKDHPGVTDPVDDWGIVTGDRIIDVAFAPGGPAAQMIPAGMFIRHFGSDCDNNPEHYQPVSEPTPATRRFSITVDGWDSSRCIKRGHLDWPAGMPEAAMAAALDSMRVVEREGLLAEAAPETAPSPEMAPAPRQPERIEGIPLLETEPDPDPDAAVHTGGLTDRLAGMYPYYVLGALLGTRWETSKEIGDDGRSRRPVVDVYFEPRVNPDGSMAYRVNREAVSLSEPNVSIQVYPDHLEVNGPGFQDTSYWDLPESHRAPIGAVVLWQRNWLENRSPSSASPLYLAYPVYAIGELEIGGSVVPMIPVEDLESCFRIRERDPEDLPFGDFQPVSNEDNPFLALSEVPGSLSCLARLAGKPVLVQAPMCLDTDGDLPHKVVLTDAGFDGLIRQALGEAPLLMTMGRLPEIPGAAMAQAPEPPATVAQAPEPPAAPAERTDGHETARQLYAVAGGISAMLNGVVHNLETVANELGVRLASGQPFPVTAGALRQLVGAAAGTLRAVACSLDAVQQALPEDE